MLQVRSVLSGLTSRRCWTQRSAVPPSIRKQILLAHQERNEDNATAEDLRDQKVLDWARADPAFKKLPGEKTWKEGTPREKANVVRNSKILMNIYRTFVKFRKEKSGYGCVPDWSMDPNDERFLHAVYQVANVLRYKHQYYKQHKHEPIKVELQDIDDLPNFGFGGNLPYFGEDMPAIPTWPIIHA